MTESVTVNGKEKEAKSSSLLVYRVKFLALIGVFISPFIAGWLAFYVFDYRPVSKNYGELVQPVRSMSFPVLSDVKGDEIPPEFWSKWTFVILHKNDCDELCRKNLYFLRQMRTSLGRDMGRLQNVMMLAGQADQDLQSYISEYPNLTVIPDVGNEVFSSFDMPGIQVGETSMLYLMDPAGNLMMTYSAVNDPPSILSDLRRLLKLSQIG